jgi:DNA-binding protein HU-beta
MNKVDLIRAAMERYEMSRKDATALIDGVFDDIQAAVCSGEAVKIPGFGQFKVRDRAARIARNPATGEPVKVPAKRVFKFLPAKALKEAVMSRRGGAKAAAGRKKAAAASSRGAAKKAAPRKVAARKTGAKKSAAGRKKR